METKKNGVKNDDAEKDDRKSIATDPTTHARWEEDKVLILQRASEESLLIKTPEKNQDYLNLLLDMLEKEAKGKKGGKA